MKKTNQNFYHQLKYVAPASCDINTSTASVPITGMQYWYAAGGVTSSSVNQGKNVGDTNQWEQWMDWSGNNRKANTPGGNSLYTFDKVDCGTWSSPNYSGVIRLNDKPVFNSDYRTSALSSATEQANMVVNTITGTFSAPSVGTMAIVWRTAENELDSSYVGNHWWGSIGKYKSPPIVGPYVIVGAMSYGKTMSVFGDNTSYSWDLRPGKWYIQILSVPSPGVTNYCKTNGYGGSNCTYYQTDWSVPDTKTQIELGVYYPNYLDKSPYTDVRHLVGRSESLAEIIYWNKALSALECKDVEDYLRNKWCIQF